jgi:hypothetical protein
LRLSCLNCLVVLCGFVPSIATHAQGAPSRARQTPDPVLELARDDGRLGSPYIPLDSWIYPALTRLQALGYADGAYLGLRPWTRLNVANMLAETSDKLSDHPEDEEAWSIFQALTSEIAPDLKEASDKKRMAEIDRVYTRVLGIAGTPLRDSFHVGQTIVNDYGRPYQEGFNDVSGFGARATSVRFSLDFRGEFQRSPSASGYSTAIAQTLSTIDLVPFGANQATIPEGPIASTSDFRVLEANLSVHLLNHEISFGKSDEWMGVASGGGMAWSNNAENIYSFRINRTEPLRIPGLSVLTGPFRYDFLVGSLKGHTDPNAPWIHAEKVSFKPTRNVEIGFERSVIWGGKGHAPITLHTFLKSFFSFQNVTAAEKFSRSDPGARWGAFDFSYRLPYLRNWVTLYSDSIAHDDVSPASAPRRASVRPGIYLSHFPGMAKLDLRVEAVSTDPPTARSNGGQFNYDEVVQAQGYTNKGQIIGDWIGREAKGGQAWMNYHLSPSERIQISYRNTKAAKDFIPGGTTQHDFALQVVKRLNPEIELNAWIQAEEWKAPLLKSGSQNNFSTAVQITWYPKKLKR